MKQHYYFSKYHGLGNDFIIIDAIGQRIDEDLIRAEASLLCSRHTGIGADGIILVLESSECDLKMKIFNKDGTCPEMCGNGLRCFARFAFEQKLIEKELFSVETDAGKMLPGLRDMFLCRVHLEIAQTPARVAEDREDALREVN